MMVLSTSVSTRQEKVTPGGPGQIEHYIALNYELIFIHPTESQLCLTTFLKSANSTIMI